MKDEVPASRSKAVAVSHFIIPHSCFILPEKC
jgi:hypothetical protein